MLHHDIEDGTGIAAATLRQLVASLDKGLQTLGEENRRLQATVDELSAEIARRDAYEETRQSLDEWLVSIGQEAERRKAGGSTPAAGRDLERLELLGGLVRFLASNTASEPASGLDHASGFERALDSERVTSESERSPEPEPVPRLEGSPGSELFTDITPEAVLAGPTADAPPHRIRSATRHSIPGMAGVRLREQPRYDPGWWDRHAPWAIDVLVRLDLDRVERAIYAAGGALDEVLARLVSPLEPMIEEVGLRFRRARAVASNVFDALMSALPVPAAVRDWFWPSVTDRGASGRVPAQITVKSRYESMVWLGIIVSVCMHFALFVFWPTLEAHDLSVVSEELTSIELPPEVEIPPPPQQISRPATPVMATDASVEEDITIAPTTFEENPVEDLPPPPEDVSDDVTSNPTFTPFTVAPRITNAEELAALMRSAYPAALREAGIGGEVVAWFYIDAEGRVVETRIFRSSGYEDLDRAALDVANRFEFTPALDGDRNVPVWIQFPLTFRVR